jgi:hypothetical protein
LLFYDNVAYVYGYNKDVFQGEYSRQIDLSAGSGKLHDYLVECSKKMAA